LPEQQIKSFPPAAKLESKGKKTPNKTTLPSPI